MSTKLGKLLGALLLSGTLAASVSIGGCSSDITPASGTGGKGGTTGAGGSGGRGGSGGISNGNAGTAAPDGGNDAPAGDAPAGDAPKAETGGDAPASEAGDAPAGETGDAPKSDASVDLPAVETSTDVAVEASAG